MRGIICTWREGADQYLWSGEEECEGEDAAANRMDEDEEGEWL